MKTDTQTLVGELQSLSKRFDAPPTSRVSECLSESATRLQELHETNVFLTKQNDKLRRQLGAQEKNLRRARA